MKKLFYGFIIFISMINSASAQIVYSQGTIIDLNVHTNKGIFFIISSNNPNLTTCVNDRYWIEVGSPGYQELYTMALTARLTSISVTVAANDLQVDPDSSACRTIYINF